MLGTADLSCVDTLQGDAPWRPFDSLHGNGLKVHVRCSTGNLSRLYVCDVRLI